MNKQKTTKSNGNVTLSTEETAELLGKATKVTSWLSALKQQTRQRPFVGKSADGKFCVVCYKVTLSDVLDLVNIGLDIALIATGKYTLGSLFLAADLLLTNDDLMENHIVYLLDKGPNAKGKILMTRINDQFMEKLLRDDPVTFEQYYGRNKKGARQSAANILPILVKKGMIQDYHHQKIALLVLLYAATY